MKECLIIMFCISGISFILQAFVIPFLNYPGKKQIVLGFNIAMLIMATSFFILVIFLTFFNGG